MLRSTHAVVGLLGLCLAAAVTQQSWGAYFSPSIVTSSSYTLLEQVHQSSLYQMEVGTYEWPILVAKLVAPDRQTMGYDYGYLLAGKIKSTFDVFISSLLPGEIKEDLFEAFLDFLWLTLGAHTPQEFHDEIAGVDRGCVARGVEGCDLILSRMIVMANFPSDDDDLLGVVIEDFWNWLFSHKHTEPSLSTLRESVMVLTSLRKAVQSVARKLSGCSMFGVWGSRTANAELFAGRNLDWTADSGIARNKLITVYSLAGTVSHATFGFAGFMGALAGMSAAGLTVHEANLEMKVNNFDGFPWALRLRWIMESATSISQAKSMWQSSTNTVGFNHQICSTGDARCLLLETMQGYTAYFFDDDAREANSTYVDPATGKTLPFGRPLPEATFRTNHGYDPVIRANYNWPTTFNAFQSSVYRYFLLSNQFSMYYNEGIAMSVVEAVNTTALIGTKGPVFWECNPQVYHQGSNVLSVTMRPSQLVAYVAWEDGHNATWVPAACNSYVEFDMKFFL